MAQGEGPIEHRRTIAVFRQQSAVLRPADRPFRLRALAPQPPFRLGHRALDVVVAFLEFGDALCGETAAGPGHADQAAQRA